MKSIELIEFTEFGEVIFNRGKITKTSSFKEIVDVVGELTSEGDHRDIYFYHSKGQIFFWGKEIVIKFIIADEIFSSMYFWLSDEEIVRLTGNNTYKTTSFKTKTNRKDISVVKKTTLELYDKFTTNLKEYLIGRKYLRKSEHCFCDVSSPNSKWIAIEVRPYPCRTYLKSASR